MSQIAKTIKPLCIEPQRIFTPTACLEDACVITNEGGSIDYVGPKSCAPDKNGFESIQAPDLWLAPGFIDIHTHGGNGIAFGVGNNLAEDLEAYSQWMLKSGVTGFICSVVASSSREFNKILAAYVPLFEKGSGGARALGLHLEGPFLNPQKKGVFILKWLRTPSLKEAREYIRIGGKWIRQVSLAPELDGSLDVAREFRKVNITVALAHSDSDYDTACSALMGDFTHVTHTFNCLPGFNHRALGAVGAILNSDEITAELICDDNLVHPGAMRMLLRCLGPERVVIITDASTGAGLPDGSYELLGQKIIVKGGKSILENGTLAGSTALLNQCVRNVHQMAGASVQEAIRMATTNPARVIGLERQMGLIASGRLADLILMDDQFEIQMAMVGGNILFNQL